MKNTCRIKALVMDVDGTLTDGGIYVGNDGECMKRFHVKDGYGIHVLLPALGITPIIITGRKSKILENRCKELGIDLLVQGSSDKTKDMLGILDRLGIPLAQTAYIGDDMNDYDAMKLVGIRGCPDDAAEGIQAISDYITAVNGGCGAVREFIEWIGQNFAI